MIIWQAKQEEEFNERKSFIDQSKLFGNWMPQLKRLLEISLRKQICPFDSYIVRQGKRVNGLTFVIKSVAFIFYTWCFYFWIYIDFIVLLTSLRPVSKSISYVVTKKNRKAEADSTTISVLDVKYVGFVCKMKIICNRAVRFYSLRWIWRLVVTGNY